MKKLYIFAVMMAGSLSAAGQDAYDAANFTQQDLNGTAPGWCLENRRPGKDEHVFRPVGLCLGDP